jgi:coat protein Gp5
MANTLVTPTWVVNETAYQFMNSVKGVPNFNRTYDDQYKQAGAKVGDTVQARLPQRYSVRRGQGWSPQALYDRTMPISLSYQTGVDFDYSSVEATLEVDKVRERYVAPAANTLASDADQQGMADVYTSIYHNVGTIGTTPSSNQTYLNAGVKLTNFSAEMDGRIAVLDPRAMATLVNSNLTLFNPSSEISHHYKKGMFGSEALGIGEWYQDQNMPAHTTGSFTACSPTVNGANQTGSTLNTQAWASGATSLKKGDCFTIAGVYSVNPISRVSTGELQDFVITADSTDTTGNITALPISPSIITSGALQTVSASPASGAAISVWGKAAGGALSATVSKQSLLFHPNFAAFVMADLVEPVGGAKSNFARSKDWGISIRMVQQYLIGTDQNGTRLDILFGAAPIEAGFGARVVG